MRINTDKNCNIVIYDDTEYPINGLTYKNSVSLYIAQLNESNKSTIIYQKFDKHDGTGDNPIILAPQKGGFITMCHIILPKTISDGPGNYLKVRKLITKNQINNILGIIEDTDTYIPQTEDFVQSETYIRLNQINDILGIAHSQESQRTFQQIFVGIGDYITLDQIDSLWNGNTILRSTQTILQAPLTNTNGSGYYSDGEKIYYSNGSSTRQASIQEILEVNPSAYNFVKTLDNFFSVCYLRKCYISLCQKIFKARGFNRCFIDKVDTQLTYKRDLVWAALNVIQYMIDSNQLAEAQRLLERINGCNGLCSKEETGDQGCGCES